MRGGGLEALARGAERGPRSGERLGKSRALADRLPLHVERLEQLRRLATATPDQGLQFPNSDTWWQFQTLSKLVGDLQRFANNDPYTGTLASVARRLEYAQTVEETTIGKHREDWEQACASIRDRTKCPLYDGIDLPPQLGLVPLRRNPESGLWEFWHVRSGDEPRTDGNGRLAIEDRTGVVLVLLPGGKFMMGSPDDKDTEERPQCSVNISAFFLSKYEMTQGQWERFTGNNPSIDSPRSGVGSALLSAAPGRERRLGHLSSRRHAYGSPASTEARWEYAARAGSAASWWTGPSKERLGEATNLADKFLKNHGYPEMAGGGLGTTATRSMHPWGHSLPIRSACTTPPVTWRNGARTPRSHTPSRHGTATDSARRKGALIGFTGAVPAITRRRTPARRRLGRPAKLGQADIGVRPARRVDFSARTAVSNR